MNLQAIYQDFKKDLLVIEHDLAVSLHTNQEHIYRVVAHPLEAGGKRLRPLLVFLLIRCK